MTDTQLSAVALSHGCYPYQSCWINQTSVNVASRVKHTHTHYSVHEIICSCVSVWSVQEGLILGESRIEEQVTISDSQADHIHIEEVYSKLDTVAHSKTSSLSHYDHLYFFNRYPEAHRLPQTERVSTAGQAITSLTPLTQTPLPNC